MQRTSGSNNSSALLMFASKINSFAINSQRQQNIATSGQRLFHDQPISGEAANVRTREPEELLKQALLEQTLNTLMIDLDPITNDDKKIELINNAQELAKKREIVAEMIAAITQQCFDSDSRGESMLRIIAIILRSNLPLSDKFFHLEICLEGLFIGHSEPKTIVEGGGIAEIIQLGQSDNFQQCSLIVKNLIILLASANKAQFRREGGFTQSMRDLLNAKRSKFGFLENFFRMESTSIKICRQHGLID